MMKNGKLLILDVDGVLTDGRKFYDSSGKVVCKSFCDRDFTAIKQFKACGWKVCFLSGDRNINEIVAKNRNIDFYCNRDRKMICKSLFIPKFEKIYQYTPADMVYVGDDVFDIEIMKKVQYAFCPSDAPRTVLDVCIPLNSKSGDNVIQELFHYFIQEKIVDIPAIETIIQLDTDEKF